MHPDRRRALRTLLGAGAGLTLRSLATGLPPAFFLHPARAMAAAAAADGGARSPQFLVLSTSGSGDPMNANVPGCYLDPGIAHPTAATMAPTKLTLGGQSYTAAAPWASLGQATLERSLFLHHATNTVVHPDEAKVLRLMGGVANNDNLPSLLGQLLQGPLGCLQGAPVALGAGSSGEYIAYQGRPQAPLTPMALATVLGDPNGPLSGLQDARDKDLDAIVAWLKQGGNQSQAAFLDRYASSHAQVRDISDALMAKLAAITDNGIGSQFAAATVLAQMKFAPVFTVHMGFGGDNHSDANLAGEANGHVASLAALANFFTGLQAVGMQDEVTFATLNVFGRTLGRKGTAGRDHQANHHVVYAAGKHVAPGVYGGVVASGSDYTAQPIDSRTGLGSAGGDLPLKQHLGVVGRTLGSLCGVDDATLAAKVTTGATLQAAVRSA
jgi:hypothetical protein